MKGRVTCEVDQADGALKFWAQAALKMTTKMNARRGMEYKDRIIIATRYLQFLSHLVLHLNATRSIAIDDWSAASHERHMLA
jgi:putative cell wall-binding protein